MSQRGSAAPRVNTITFQPTLIEARMSSVRQRRPGLPPLAVCPSPPWLLLLPFSGYAHSRDLACDRFLEDCVGRSDRPEPRSRAVGNARAPRHSRAVGHVALV